MKRQTLAWMEFCKAYIASGMINKSSGSNNGAMPTPEWWVFIHAITGEDMAVLKDLRSKTFTPSDIEKPRKNVVWTWKEISHVPNRQLMVTVMYPDGTKHEYRTDEPL